MPRGSRPGERRGGRQRGTPNKKTALMKAAFDAADVGLTPLDFMLGIMKDTTVLPQLRLKAAEAAAPYVHAKPGRSQATDPAVSAKPIEWVCEAGTRDRLLELTLADFSKGLSGAEAEELERLRKAYPPDPNDPLAEAMRAWREAGYRNEKSEAGSKS